MFTLQKNGYLTEKLIFAFSRHAIMLHQTYQIHQCDQLQLLYEHYEHLLHFYIKKRLRDVYIYSEFAVVNGVCYGIRILFNKIN